jgi:hypothetical protein
MFVRLGLFTLALATLLISIIAEAQPLQSPSPQCAAKTNAADECLQDVAVIWLHVVKDGKIKKLAFEPQELADMPSITIDGYVNGIVLLSKNLLSVSVNGKPMSPIRMNADGYYKLKYYGNISRQDFWSTFLPAEKKSESSEKIQGCYSIFPKVPGDALSHAPKFQITLNQKHTSHHLTIHQDAVAKLDLRAVLPVGSDAPEFYYLGSNFKQFDYTSKAFRKRVDALLAGIKNIERITDGKLVKTVHIIDYELAHNAYTCNNENTIWLYSKLLWQEPVQELRVIAEHETMHILSDQLGLSVNSRMRELFAELMGFGLFSLERFYVVSSGANPPLKPMKPISNSSKLFDFVNEVNFIRGMNGGHSQDNLDEFCASFLHTLMYIDRLAPLLSMPIKSRSGSLIQLSTAEQANLFNEYNRVLETIVSETDKLEITGSLAEFLNRCQTTALKAGRPSTAHQRMADLTELK